MKKLTALFLAVVMMMALATSASAAGTGSITVDNAVTGVTYSLYKIADVAPVGTGFSYKVESGWKDFFGTSGVDTHAKLSTEDYIVWLPGANVTTFAALASAWTGKPAALASIVATSNTVEFDTLEKGYYLVKSSAGTVGALVQLDTDSDTASFSEKNTVALPALEKTVEKSVVEIGETVKFTITITADSVAEEYVLTDTMPAGFAGPTNIKLTWLDYSVSSTSDLTKDNDYTEVIAGNDFTITFQDTFLDKVAEQDKITLTYETALNGDAEINTEIVNNVQLAFKDGTRDDSASVKTYQLTVKKTDENAAALAGAGFVLQNDEDKYAVLDANGKIESWETDIKNATVLTTVVDGGVAQVVFKGLGNETYTVVEKTVPTGYTQAADKNVTINNANGEVTVENVKGATLPETGGMGTTALYIGGAVLMLGALVVLANKKRGQAK